MLQARVRDRLSPVRGNVLARIRACRPGDGFEHRANFEPIPLDHRSRTIRLVSRSKKYVTRYSPSSITTSEEEQILRAKDTQDTTFERNNPEIKKRQQFKFQAEQEKWEEKREVRSNLSADISRRKKNSKSSNLRETRGHRWDRRHSRDM